MWDLYTRKILRKLPSSRRQRLLFLRESKWDSLWALSFQQRGLANKDKRAQLSNAVF